MDSKAQDLIQDVKDALSCSSLNSNIARSERFLSVATGTYILYKGITSLFRKPVSALLETAMGGALILRGATGYCPMKERMGLADQEVTVVEHHVVETSAATDPVASTTPTTGGSR